MRLPRVRIWWLMAFIAAVALGISVVPRWWAWHHEMLRASQYHWDLAVSWEATVAHSRRWHDEIITGKLPNRFGEPLTELLERADELDRVSRRYRLQATFPWLDPPE